MLATNNKKIKLIAYLFLLLVNWNAINLVTYLYIRKCRGEEEEEEE